MTSQRIRNRSVTKVLIENAGECTNFCRLELSFAIDRILCYTNKNSAFAEINSLKTDFKEVFS